MLRPCDFKPACREIPHHWSSRLARLPNIHVLFDWQHAGFGSPVVYAPGGFARTSDLFMIRFENWS